MSELGLTSKGRIDPARLDRENYVQSLTEEAVRCGIMTEGDTDRLRTELLSVLAQVIGYKTGGETHSFLEKFNQGEDGEENG